MQSRHGIMPLNPRARFLSHSRRLPSFFHPLLRCANRREYTLRNTYLHLYHTLNKPLGCWWFASRHRSFRFMHQSPHCYNYQLIITCFLPLWCCLCVSLHVRSIFLRGAVDVCFCQKWRSAPIRCRVFLILGFLPSVLSLPIPIASIIIQNWLMQLPHRLPRGMERAFADQ